MLQKTFALTERALRVDARMLLGHLMRFVIAAGVMCMLYFVIAFDTDAQGRSLLTSLVMGNAVLITVLAPIYFGDCITEEKEEKTLPLLLLADIRPLALLGGKVLPRLLAVGLILAVQLPFTLLAVTLGGVVMNQLLAAYLALAVYLWAISGLSTLMSVFFRQSSSAVGASVAMLLLYYVGPGLLLLAGALLSVPELQEFGMQPVGKFLTESGTSLYSNNLFSRLSLIMESGFAERWEMLQSGQVIAGGITGAAAFLAAWLLFDICNRDLDAEIVRQKRSRLVGTSQRAWAWPVVWKDYNLIGGGHRQCFIKLGVYGVLVLGSAAAAVALGASLSEAIIGPIYLVFLFTWLECQFLLATSFSYELKDQTWSSLAALPHSVPVLAGSKALGSLLAMWPILLWGILVGLWGALLMAFSIPDLQLELPTLEVLLIMLLATTGGVLYFLIYLHIVVFYAVWSKNRWLAIVGAFFTQYVGNCMLYCIVGIPILVFSTAGETLGSELLAIALGGGFSLSVLIGILALLEFQILTMLNNQHDA